MGKKKLEKHLAFYAMRDELRKARHCAFCSLERKAVHQFLDGLLYEKVTDPGIRGALVRSAGFCPRHAHMLAGFGDALGTAILYEDQVKLRLESLRKMSAPRGRRRSPAPREARGQKACPGCAYEGELRARHTRTLLQGLSDPEMAEAFSSSPGLCFPHFSRVLEEAEDPVARSFLTGVQRGKMERLLLSLREFAGKHDYRRASEGFAEEKDSWLRAVELVSGLKDVF